jgi:hypothetical protein
MGCFGRFNENVVRARKVWEGARHLLGKNLPEAFSDGKRAEGAEVT